MWSTGVKDPSKSTKRTGSNDPADKHTSCNDPQTFSLAKMQCIATNLKANKKLFATDFTSLQKKINNPLFSLLTSPMNTIEKFKPNPETALLSRFRWPRRRPSPPSNDPSTQKTPLFSRFKHFHLLSPDLDLVSPKSPRTTIDLQKQNRYTRKKKHSFPLPSSDSI